jgi:hypothetical protein
MNARLKKKEIHFMHLGNKEIYYILLLKYYYILL